MLILPLFSEHFTDTSLSVLFVPPSILGVILPLFSEHFLTFLLACGQPVGALLRCCCYWYYVLSRHAGVENEWDEALRRNK